MAEAPVERLNHLKQKLDLIGVNYYTRGLTQNDPATLIERAKRVRKPRAACSETAWEVFPQELTDILV